MKFKFDVSHDLLVGIERLSGILGYECSPSGICVKSEKGEKIGVTLGEGGATIYYRDKVQFYRGLGVLVENLKKSRSFEIFDDGHFTTISAMIDASRCSAPTVKTAKRLLDHLALMGYNMMMLYTEDMIELEGRPYFGYMRGRYSIAELREIDDYAYEYGIEVTPCLECYGHMERYLYWDAAADIKDTVSVMLAREEKTFELVEQIIATASSAFRSRRVHIGMDEAWNMGRGKFLDKHGYVPPFDIFNEYMTRLTAIIKKYNLSPMMWSDMYFRVRSKNDAYYDKETVIPEETKRLIPEGMTLVFWHYGEEPWCDNYMLKKHAELGRNIMYAGGNWGWIGHFPEHNYMMQSTKFSLNASRDNNVREAMLTIWGNDNAECDIFANLFSLSYFAEMCYDKDADENKLRARFETVSGADYDLFYKMSYYHNDFENGDDYPNYHDRFLGKPLFWQDILGGLHDYQLFEKPMSEHYRATAKLYEGKVDGEWGYLYEYAYRAFDYLAEKTYIAERLHPAYNSGDKATLRDLLEVHLPSLKEKTHAIHEAHRTAWFRNSKVLGWQNLDIRYAGVVARCDTAIMLISMYLDGKIDKIEELEEPRLYRPLFGFDNYSRISSVNNVTK